MYRKLVSRLCDLARQGFTPEKIALTVVLGVALGTIPVLGFTSLLCAAVASALKLNLPVIQLVNWLVYPAQIALLVPFLKMGEALFGGHLPAMTVPAILHLIRSDLGRAIGTLGVATLHALAAWAICGAAALILTHWVLVPVLRRLSTRENCPTA